MKIAYIDQSGELGGAEHLLLTLLDGLPKDKISPLLICAHDGPFLEQARKKGIPTITVLLPHFFSISFLINHRKIFNPLALFWNALSLFRSAWRVMLCLRAAKIDLVQTNSAFAHIYGGLAARMVGVPCIWYFHDLVETDRLSGSFALAWKTLASLLANRVVGVSDAVIRSLSIDARGCVIYAGLPEGNVFCNRPVSDIRANLGIPDDAILVGYIGRLAFVKGLDILALAAKNICQVNPRVHFILYGEELFNEIGYKNVLIKKIEDLKLKDHWHWMGYDIHAASKILDFDMLVLPSRREALGLVLVEAGLASKVVVASRIGGISEVIKNGETGVLVSPENPDELTSAMLQLLGNPILSIEMGQRANIRVKSLFNLERYYAEFLTLYASLS
jgi:glycosyltransferase involved in cell wall biosynthesis